MAYIPKSTRRPSLLTRSRSDSYTEAIGPRNRVRKTIPTGFEAKREKTVAAAFEAKPPETVTAGFEAKPAETVTTGVEAKPVKIVRVVLRPNRRHWF
jgi:hypothetical protein